MPVARPKSKAKPALLKWARDSARFDIATAAKRAQISEETLEAWEAGTDAPSIPQLRKLAEVYKRPIVIFYLDAPPKDFEPLKDFRRIRPGGRDESPELASEIRWAHEMRDVAMEALALIGEEPPTFDLKARITDDPLVIAKKLRAALGVKTSHILACKDHYAAYGIWRHSLDELGVLSFQFSKVNVKEARGFSINDRPLPVVAVNASDAVSARIFTLLHEASHLVLGNAGTCDLKRGNETEVWCNAVAAEAVVPRAQFLAETEVSSVGRAVEWEEAVIRTLANRYRVSREVIVRRLLEVGLTTQDFYREKRAEYAQEQRSAESGGDYYRNFRAKHGQPLIRAVLSAYEGGKLTANEAAAYLRVKVPHLAKLVPS